MHILRCGLLLSILSYQLLAFRAVAQNACLFSSTKTGTCKPYADCMEIHGKVIFENDACEENTYCCPHNRHNTKHNELVVNSNQQNPLLMDEYAKRFWNIFMEDPNPYKNVARASKPLFEPGVEIIPNINNPWYEDVSIYSDINDSMDEEDTY